MPSSLREFKLLVFPRRGADRRLREFGVVQPGETLVTRAARTVLGDAPPPGLLAGRSPQVPEGEAEGRTIAEVNVAVAALHSLRQVLVVEIRDFGNQKERGCPAGAVDAIVFSQQQIFRGGADAALGGNPHGQRRCGGDPAMREQGYRVSGVQLGDQFFPLLWNSSRIGPSSSPFVANA